MIIINIFIEKKFNFSKLPKINKFCNLKNNNPTKLAYLINKEIKETKKDELTLISVPSPNLTTLKDVFE